MRANVLVQEYKAYTMTQTKYLHELVQYLISAQDQETMMHCLGALLTPSELIEISKRLQIIKMLKQGVAQREIAKQLGVGIATVTRGSRVAKYNQHILKEI